MDRSADSRWTRLAYAAGTLAAAACLAIGIGLRVLEGPAGGGQPPGGGPVPAEALLAGLLELRPAAWATLGAAILLATPPLGLVATALEARRSSPIVGWLSLAVLGVLAASLLLALS